MLSYNEWKEIGAMTAAEVIQQVQLDVGQSARKIEYVVEYLAILNDPKLNKLIPLLKKYAADLNNVLDEV